MPVKFKEHLVHDQAPPAVIEDAFKAYASFSSIHERNFDNFFDMFMNPLGWVQDFGLNFVIDTETYAWDNPASEWDDEITYWV